MRVGGEPMAIAGKDPELVAQWARVKGHLRSEFGDTTYQRWLKPLTLIEGDSNEVTLAVPTRFLRDWIATHYGERLRAIWSGIRPNMRNLEVVVDNGRDDAAAVADEAPKVSGAASSPAGQSVAADGDQPEDVSAPLDPRFTFENFVVGKPNELAYAAARRVADAGTVPFNPLFLYGGVGLGKTHLMHAIAWQIRQQDPQRR